MKFSLRSLAPVIGIPTGYLPLIAMVETGPAEVAVTLLLLMAFGFREAIGVGRAAHEARWSRWAWSAAKIAFAYGCCLVVGMAVAKMANANLRPTPLQRWLFGDSLLVGLTSLFVRFFQLSLCAFTCWAAAMAMMSRRRSALWLALLATPIVFTDFWLLLAAIGPAMFDGWCGPVLASLFALGPVVITARRRSLRRKELAQPVSTAQSVEPIELVLARRKEPIQFTLGALFALVTICAVWLGLVVYSSREERRPRAMRTVPVSGMVTYEGQPLAKVHVVFYPSDSTVGKAAGGVTNDSGVFELQTWVGGSMTAPGAFKGDYVVTVTKEAVTAVQPDSTSPAATIPARFADMLHSGLRATVVDNKLNRFTFELQAEPEP